VREGEGVAAAQLKSLGVSLDTVRSEVIRVLNQGVSRASSSHMETLTPTLGPAILQGTIRLDAPLDRLNDAAKSALGLAGHLAHSRGDAYIGTEHLLLGLLAGVEGIHGQVLPALGVTGQKVEDQLASLPGEGDRRPPGRLALATRAKGAIERAVQEAQARDQSLAGTGHLLLGLLAGGVAAEALERLGVSLEAVRAAVERRLSSGEA
jgi:hypothetical protein